MTLQYVYPTISSAVDAAITNTLGKTGKQMDKSSWDKAVRRILVLAKLYYKRTKAV